jgi:hypothetical protein
MGLLAISSTYDRQLVDFAAANEIGAAYYPDEPIELACFLNNIINLRE